MDEKEIPWINFNEKVFEKDMKILIKTDCLDCPLNVGNIILGKLYFAGIIQCEKHYLHPRKALIEQIPEDELINYYKRITHWVELEEDENFNMKIKEN